MTSLRSDANPPRTQTAASDDYSAHQPGSFIANIAVAVAGRQRRRLYDLFLQVAGVAPEDSILDVGVTSDERYATNNYLEHWYPHKGRITAAGLADESYLPARYPGMRYVTVEPHAKLPFADAAFDVVHASAVIEHAGSREQQARFLGELWRVCRKAVFVTTPNRWFPVEVHTAIPLLHWLPPRAFRACLRACNLSTWSDESQLNLLSRRDLLAVAGSGGLTSTRVRGVRLAGWTSNLALVARR